MPRNHKTNHGKELSAPLKIVRHFFLEFYEHRNVDAALRYAADDMEFHGLGAPHTDLWNKEEIRSELEGMTSSEELLHVLSVSMTPRLLGENVCLVSGSITLGEGSDTLLLEICLVAICRQNEDGWKIIQLHTYFPWEEGSYQYNGIFEIKQDYAQQMRKEFWQSRLPGGLFGCYDYAPFGLVAINDSLLHQLGFQSQLEFQEFSGISIVNIIHPDDVAAFLELTQKKQNGQKEQAIVCRMRKKDFSFGTFALRGHKEQDEKYGTILVCSCNDITQEVQQAEKQSEAYSGETTENVEYMLENMAGGGYRCRLLGDRSVDYISDGMCRLTGYSRGEIETQFHNDFSRLIYEADREEYRVLIEQMKAYTHTDKIKYRIHCRDGSLKWVLDTLKSVREADRTMWVYGLLIDVHREHTETRQLERFLDVLPTGLAVAYLQNDGIWIQHCNEKLLKLLGRSENEVEGQNLYEWVHKEDKLLLRQCMERLQIGEPTGTCQIGLTVGEKQVHVLANVQERIQERLTIYLALSEVDWSEPILTKTHRTPEVEIRTFGYFDVYVDGKPIPFQSAKAKELLALLVDRGGGYVSATEIISCLWENEEANKVTLARCRKVAMRLTDKLREYGIEEIIESVNGARRVVPSCIHCDLYDYLDHKPGSENLFKGSYLTNYSWGEMTLSNLLAGTV